MKSKLTKKLLGVGLLTVISVFIFITNFNQNPQNSKKSKAETNTNIVNDQIESSKDNILDINELPNEGNEEKTTIWIKNINILADNNISYSDIMNLKSKLNTELKTLDKEIYEVNLKEETFKKTEDGFKIEAKADKLSSTIKIELKGYEYIFTISS